MTKHRESRGKGKEAGNAVTLTLLGLAVAILAGVVVLFYIGKNAPEPIVPITTSDKSTNLSVEEVDPRAGWNTHEDQTYEFSFQYPPGWIVVTDMLFGNPAISVYSAQGATGTPPYSHLDVGIPHVSVYPHGLSTEGLFAELELSDIIIKIPEASAKDYLLSSGRPWGTLVRFDKYPASWEEYGFVFASAAIEELEFGCLQNGEEVAVDECNHFEGDQTLIHGYVDSSMRALEREILLSLRFVEEVATTGTSTAMVEQTEDLITVRTPETGEVIESPLVVSGEARGSWYFEGDFPVRLETSLGELLAEVPATALGDWMTEDFVPFEVSVAFEETTATSGQLVLLKDNPSGLPEYDMQVVIPILFAHKETQTSAIE